MEFKIGADFDRGVQEIASTFVQQSQTVDTGHWQSLSDVPQTKTWEIENVLVNYQIPMTQEGLANSVKPNLPWAELQFQERVAGAGTNPGETYHLWPYFKGNVPKHQKPEHGNQFSHTYMERFWPNSLADEYATGRREGIRYGWGDFEDVLQLLNVQPYTRQAYLPIFFPEDTGAHHGERVPCTLGYHFMRRRVNEAALTDGLHVMYPIRSCDFFRHFRDDVYMAARLAQEIISRLNWSEEPRRVLTFPGELRMHIHSLHVFKPELPLIERMADPPEYEFEAAAV